MDLDDVLKFYKILRDKKLSPNVPKGSNLQDYYDAGVIKKEDLVDGAYYQGICRNSSIAQWSAKDNCFWYMRSKFGYTYKEDINYIADDNGFDLFIPFVMIKGDWIV
jgi:hypothetical protein